MKIELTNLRIKGIRNFRDLTLDFCTESGPNHITTIQMPNGTGKTTTLCLLRYLFSGEQLSPTQIASYRPDTSTVSEGTAILNIKINGDPLTVFLNLNYEEGTYTYNTKSTKIGGFVEGHKIPNEYKISPDMVDLFIFDGEFAKNLFKSSSNVAEQSIDCLYGLSKVNNLSDNVKRLREQIKTNSKSKIARASSLDQKKAKLFDLEACKERINEEISQTQNEIGRINEELADVQEQISRLQSPEIRARIEQLDQDIKNGENEIGSKTTELRMVATNPMAVSDYFSKSLNDLKDNMDSLKLPRGTSSEFFEELCDSESCICGAKMTPEMRDAIKLNSKKYLSDELAGVMNNIKSNITTNRDDTESLNSLISYIHRLKRDVRDNETERSDLRRSLGGNDTQQQYGALVQKEAELKGNLNDALDALSFSTDELINNDERTNLPACCKAIDRLIEEIGAGDELITQLSKCDVAITLFTAIYEKAMADLKNRVIEVTNKTLQPILGNDIIVTNIDRSIKIKNKEEGSEGQELTTGYAYITALFKDSEFRLPFIIDSPCGSLDLTKRAYLAKIIPSFFDQVVFLVTSSERHSFTDIMLKTEDIHPYTIWKNDTESDLTVSSDLDYFNKFQIDYEEVKY